MNKHKLQKLEKHFFRLLLQAMLNLKDPIFRFVNINRIHFHNSINKCTVFYTLYETTHGEHIQVQLTNKIGILKRNMSKHWTHHTFPQLIFMLDKNLIAAQKVHDILNNLKQQDGSK